MSHTSKILQAMKPGCVYRPCDLGHLGIDPGTVATLPCIYQKGGLVECITSGEYKRKKMYTTKQQDLYEAAPQCLIEGARVRGEK